MNLFTNTQTFQFFFLNLHIKTHHKLYILVQKILVYFKRNAEHNNCHTANISCNGSLHDNSKLYRPIFEIQHFRHSSNSRHLIILNRDRLNVFNLI